MGGKSYLMMCEACGVPKRIPISVIREYIPLEAVTKIYCDNCGEANHLGKLVKNYILKVAEAEK